MVDLRAVVNIENVDQATFLVDPVNDAIGAAPRAMTTFERSEKRLAYPLRVHSERSITELQHSCGKASGSR